MRFRNLRSLAAASAGAIFIILVVSASGCGSGDKTERPSTKPDAAQVEDAAAPTASVPDSVSERWNNTARFLAGLSVPESSPIAQLTKTGEFQQHRAHFSEMWRQKQSQMLDSLSFWARRELPRKEAETVFYPFSGADALTIHTLYPDARRYVLFGLEPEGVIPPLEQLTPYQVGVNLVNLRYSMDDIMFYSFFKTIDMRGDFQRYELKGTLPLLLAFLARKGNEIRNVQRIKINALGEAEPADLNAPMNANDATTTGYRITFGKNDKAPTQTLEYFSTNVQDEYLSQNLGFQMYLHSLKPAHTYIKSASYLMHKNYFSVIRNTIQIVSNSILQDDSGMPVRYFNDETWKLTFYGAYMRPIPLFANMYQTDLLQRFQNNPAAVKPLSFGVGYRYEKGTSNLMLAVKRKSLQKQQAQTAPQPEQTEKKLP